MPTSTAEVEALRWERVEVHLRDLLRVGDRAFVDQGEDALRSELERWGARGSRDRLTSTRRRRLKHRLDLLDPEDHELGRRGERDSDHAHGPAVFGVVLRHRTLTRVQAALVWLEGRPTRCPRLDGLLDHHEDRRGLMYCHPARK